MIAVVIGVLGVVRYGIISFTQFWFSMERREVLY